MKDAEQAINVLFLCTHNSCRSQMAEGWCNFFHHGTIHAYSAGTKKTSVNTLAMDSMLQAGVDISTQYSKTLEEVKNIEFDYVFTVCSEADQSCPVFTGKTQKIHINFEDPPKLSAELTDKSEIIKIYNQVRDEIKIFVKDIQYHFNDKYLP